MSAHRERPTPYPTITFDDSRLVPLLTDTALTYCTTADCEGGIWSVTPVRPVDWLSSGERVLWGLLSDLADGLSLVVADLHRLDDTNRAVVAAVADSLGVALVEGIGA